MGGPRARARRGGGGPDRRRLPRSSSARVAAGVGAAPTMVPAPSDRPGCHARQVTPAPGAPPLPRGPCPRRPPVASTPILSRPPEPWYKRIVWPEPRYIALIVVGMLVIGIGAVVRHLPHGGAAAAPRRRRPAVGVRPGRYQTATSKKSSASRSRSPEQDHRGGAERDARPPASSPDRRQAAAAGFKRGNTDNSLTQGQQAAVGGGVRARQQGRGPLVARSSASPHRADRRADAAARGRRQRRRRDRRGGQGSAGAPPADACLSDGGVTFPRGAEHEPAGPPRRVWRPGDRHAWRLRRHATSEAIDADRRARLLLRALHHQRPAVQAHVFSPISRWPVVTLRF